MPKGLTFKLIITSVVFSITALIALPKIPIFVDSSILKLDSQFGGYEIKIPQGEEEKIIDLNEYKKSSDTGESQKITFNLSDENLADKASALNSVAEITDKRLKAAGINDYSIEIEDGNVFSIIVPSYEPTERISTLVPGNGKVRFKKVKDPEQWSQEELINFYTDVERWQDLEITESDMRGFVYSIAPTTGSAVLQISFTPEGRQKFYSVAGENIGLPIGIFVNDYDFPLIMPVISENILADTTGDPAVTGNFSQDLVNDLNTQIRNPLPYNLSVAETYVLQPLLGSDFFYSYAASFGIGLILLFIFFIYKFQLFGLIFDVTVLMSLTLFLSFVKLFSIPISPAFVAGIVLITGITSYVGYSIFSEMKKELGEGKPFDFVYQKVFFKEKGEYFVLSIFLFIFSLVSSFIVKGGTGALFNVLSTGMVSVIYFYSFAFPALVQAFGGYKK
jgi:preprotein translocase subunit SecD